MPTAGKRNATSSPAPSDASSRVKRTKHTAELVPDLTQIDSSDVNHADAASAPQSGSLALAESAAAIAHVNVAERYSVDGQSDPESSVDESESQHTASNSQDEDDEDDEDDELEEEVEPTLCYLLQLPLELLNRIAFSLDYHDLGRFAGTCEALRDLYRLEAINRLLDRSEGYRGRSFYGQIFCLEHAEPGEFGYQPFFIMEWYVCDKYAQDEWMYDSDGEELEAQSTPTTVQRIEVLVQSVDVQEYRFKLETRKYFYLKMNDGEARVDWDIFHDNSLYDGENMSWDDLDHSRLFEPTGDFIRQRFPCPECGGGEQSKITVDKVAYAGTNR